MTRFCIFLLVIAGLLSRTGWAQPRLPKAVLASAADQPTASPAPAVVSYADEMPTFAGGAAALHRYLAVHTTYPPEALRKGLSGEVVVQFVVDEQGRVLNPEVVKTSDAVFDAEALRLAWQMPWWVPGRNQGQPVRVRCTLPIKFTFKR